MSTLQRKTRMWKGEEGGERSAEGGHMGGKRRGHEREKICD